MNDKAFTLPVAVSVGLGVKLEVRGLQDMHQFLIDWPLSRRDPAYSTALEACDSARHGVVSPAQARRAFVEFAEAHQILWPDMDSVVAKKAMNELRPDRA